MRGSRGGGGSGRCCWLYKYIFIPVGRSDDEDRLFRAHPVDLGENLDAGRGGGGCILQGYISIVVLIISHNFRRSGAPVVWAGLRYSSLVV